MHSRREVLGIDGLKGAIRSMMSANAATDEDVRRDRAFELVAEGGLGVVIAALALTGAQDKYRAVAVTAERALPDSRVYTEGQSQSDTLRKLTTSLSQRIARVSSVWDRFSRTEIVLELQKTGEVCTGTGSNSSCTDTYGWVPTPKTVWHEPPELIALGIDRHNLYNWQRLLTNVGSGIGTLNAQSRGSFDLSRGGAVLDFREQALDMGISNILSVFLYGGAGAAMIKYEEWSQRLLRAIGRDDLSGIDPRYAIKRRSVLKLGAVGAGALLVRQIQKALGAGNQNILQDVQGHAARVLADIQANPEKSLAEYMTMHVHELAALLGMINRIAEQAINLPRVTEDFDYGQWKNVIRPEVENLFYDSQAAIARFIEFFNYDHRVRSYTVPTQLLQLAGSTAGTNRILSYANTRRGELTISHPLHALLLAGGFAAIAAAGEKVIFPAIDHAVGQ
ncbi:MAG: hypothetical protein WC775_05160 [Patescibacteria group bacterium]|jgi:hypothetical protein